MGPGRVSRAAGHELFDFGKRGNAAAGSGSRAVERRGSAGEIELTLKRPFLKQSIDKAGVEDVSRASGVGYRNAVGGGVDELPAIPCKHAFFSQGCGGEN